MIRAWLKSRMPRGLFARAVLILLLPVVAVTAMVSVSFMRRHIEGVTVQMTRSVSREVRYILESEAAASSRAARTLAVSIEAPPPGQAPPEGGLRSWYDVSGAYVTREFFKSFPACGANAADSTAAQPCLHAVDLPGDDVILHFETGSGPVTLRFDRYRVSADNAHQLPVAMVLVALLMTIVAFLYQRNQLRPITRLAAAAEAFGRGRNVDYRPSGAVEVRVAGNAFLDMRARIERHIEQRTLILSKVSHDMRTPLTRLKLGLSLLDPKDAEELLGDVEEMQRLIDEFLDFTRSAWVDKPTPVDPFALAKQVVEGARRVGGDVTLIEEEGQGGTIELREPAIRRAVENLVGNALRYANRAEVSVCLAEKFLRIRVEDDGPGIPAEMREEALKPFARLDAARNQDDGAGAGLGLAIAADAARAHGGTLRLDESERLGGLCADIVIGR